MDTLMQDANGVMTRVASVSTGSDGKTVVLHILHTDQMQHELGADYRTRPLMDHLLMMDRSVVEQWIYSIRQALDQADAGGNSLVNMPTIPNQRTTRRLVY